MKKYIYPFLGFLAGIPIFVCGEIATSGTATATEQSQADQKDPSAMAAGMLESAQAAKEYVALLDQGKYAESWDKAARLFQGTISRAEWEFALQSARGRLGKVTSRTIKNQLPAWDPKGLPKGPYMVIEYNTSFEKAPDSGELLTLMREKDGTWKVLTYQVN